MYGTYLRRELGGRKKQTIIIAAGLAVAIALVIVVNSLSTGVRDAQAQALASVYGVGTDLTVTGPAAQPGTGGGPRFEFGQGEGATAGGTTAVRQSRLTPDRMRTTLDASAIDTVAGVEGVRAASGALSLTNVTFTGESPDRSQAQDGAGGSARGQGGGAGGAVDLTTFTVLGIPSADAAVGPMSAVTVASGRALAPSDAGTDVAVVDATYASTNQLSVGGTIDVAGTAMKIVGIVASAAGSADTAANVYVPLDVAQTLAGVGDVVSTVYVQATSAAAVAGVESAIASALPDTTVTSESDLASTVSGSLTSASALISHLGTWLSLIVLAVALLLSVLLTISGVSRRTREFGTLKAMGWSNGRVVGQVAGESMVQGALGGAAGLALGLLGIWVIDLIAPTISIAPAATATHPGGPGGGGGARFAQGAVAATDIVLSAPLTAWVIAAALGLAILGGLVAAAFGGWRAARLRPAEALRSVN